MIELVGTLVILAVSFCVWAIARDVHVRNLRQQVHRHLNFTSEQGTQPALKAKLNAAELSAYGTITVAEYAWHWASIDPDLIQATDFASTATINSGLDFAQYIHDHYDSLATGSKEGFINRLTGYLAEQKVATLLEQAGLTVQLAETANQPIWDLLVNGHMVNVKSVADTAFVVDQASAHSDVFYLVPTDAHGELTWNMIPVDGFEHASTVTAVQEGVSVAHGEAALNGLGFHLPWVTVAFATYRNYKLVRDYNQDPLIAIRHATAESIGRGTGVVAGAKVGAFIFSPFGPISAVIGALAGGIGGSLIGSKIVEWWKRRPMKMAITRLEDALTTYGQSFSVHLPALRKRIMMPINRMRKAQTTVIREVSKRKNTFRYKVWPDYYTILLDETREIALYALQQERERAQSALDIITEAERDNNWKHLGVLMANVPHLRAVIPHDDALLEKVANAQAEVLTERKHLNPSFQPPDSMVTEGGSA